MDATYIEATAVWGAAPQRPESLGHVLRMEDMGMGQNLVPYPCSSHENSWDSWMFIPLKMVFS